MHNGLILGPPEIGKTNIVRIVLVEATMQPKFALWLSDPTGRHNTQARPFAQVASRITTSHRGFLALLRDAAQLVDARTRRGTFPDPSSRKQGILVVIEDGHEVFADNLEATGLAEQVALLGGPVSVALIVTAPDSTARPPCGLPSPGVSAGRGDCGIDSRGVLHRCPLLIHPTGRSGLVSPGPAPGARRVWEVPGRGVGQCTSLQQRLTASQIRCHRTTGSPPGSRRP
jgi:hypothetical protein